MKKRQQGFTIVEGLIILVMLGILVFTGWYVYHARNNSNATLDSAAKLSSESAKTSANSTNKTAASEAQSSDNFVPKFSFLASIPSEEWVGLSQAFQASCDKEKLAACSADVYNFEANFAQAAISDGDSGYSAIAEKSNGSWSVIWSGQMSMTQSDADKLGLPVSFGPFEPN